MPAAYDVLKNSLVIIVKKIRNSNIQILRVNKDSEPVNTVIKVKTDAGEIIALLIKSFLQRKLKNI